MIPCAGISFFITLFFVKRIPLKRDDDAAKKAEAKAWVESKKAKHQGGIWGKSGGKEESESEEEKRMRKESTATAETLVDSPGERGVVGKVERVLEEAGRGVEEAAAGSSMARNDITDQGPIGSARV